MNSSAKSVKRVQDAERRRLSHYQQLHTHLNGIIAKVRNGVINADETLKQLQDIREHVDGVGDYMSSHLPPTCYNEVRGDSSTIAERVLNIPDVLELILLNAEVVGIVAMEQVSKSIRDIIYASPKLQIKTGLKPLSRQEGQSLSYFSPFNEQQFLRVGLSALTRENRCEVHIHKQKTAKLITPGSRWTKTLVCQPPLKVMKAKLLCGGCWSYRVRDTITSTSGLTLSDIYDKAQNMSATSPPCAECIRLQNITTRPRPQSRDIDAVFFQ